MAGSSILVCVILIIWVRSTVVSRVCSKISFRFNIVISGIVTGIRSIICVWTVIVTGISSVVGVVNIASIGVLYRSILLFGITRLWICIYRFVLYRSILLFGITRLWIRIYGFVFL